MSKEVEEYLSWLRSLDMPDEVGEPFSGLEADYRGPSQRALDAIYKGVLVECMKEEYLHGVRAALQAAAGRWIDGGDKVRAQTALDEVQRLDKRFGLITGKED